MKNIAIYQDVAKQDSHNDLIDQYSNLVKKIAYHLLNRLPRSVQINDLLQSGMLGLIEAAKNFDPNNGASFESFASLRIRGAMIDDLRRGDWIPRSVYKNARLISDAIQRVEHKYGREAQSSEIAAELSISTEEYYQMLNDTSSIDLFSLDNLNSELSTENEFDNPQTKTEHSSLKVILSQELENLPEKEKLVLSLHHMSELNFKNIGEILEVSESRICQIHSQAISRLRARITAKLR